MLEQALSLRPANVDALLVLGEARQASGALDGALDALQQALAQAGTLEQREAIADRMAALSGDATRDATP